MKTSVDVTVVSAFGRGHWVASELAEKGLEVALVDLSDFMGRWTPEDWEGPFGFFHTDQLKATQVSRLIEEDYSDSIDNGFCVWLPSGPIEMKGPLTSYHLDGWSLGENVSEYLVNFDSWSEDRAEEAREDVLSSAFDRVWLIHLAHQMASPVYCDNAVGAHFGRPLPLLSPYSVRRVSRRGVEQNLEWLVDKGVQVHSKSRPVDVWGSAKVLDGIEIQGPWSGALKAKQVIWGLTSQETDFAIPKVSSTLFPRGILSPQWGWMRFRVQLSALPCLEVLPIKFVMIEDLGLPWTHDNLVLSQRTVNDQDLDLWMRLPTQNRFQRGYLDEMAQSLLRLLQKRIPGCQPKILDMPQDYLYEYNELGPTRFPVYSEAELRALKLNGATNLFFDNPERWSTMDWTGQFRYQAALVNEVQKRHREHAGPQEQTL